MNAYVVFKAQDSAQAALKANGTVFEGKHITCDIACNKVWQAWRICDLGFEND